MDFHFDPVISLSLICLLYGNENGFFDTMKFASYLVVAILLMTWTPLTRDTGLMQFS